jgi:hypothetical protein
MLLHNFNPTLIASFNIVDIGLRITTSAKLILSYSVTTILGVGAPLITGGSYNSNNSVPSIRIRG